MILLKEIETRIIKIDIEEIRKKLLDLGAIKVKEEVKLIIYMIFLIKSY